ncbi:helix-turn-helix transcriptional regulator [Nonomuraea maheshkhaliensis]|uniref:Helix-turn-helix transcriptional regulator n=1 Tax=Nonomuraea maheshkhaliensis TaxID=419590 RepID=A0ABP4QJD5_9ACTN
MALSPTPPPDRRSQPLARQQRLAAELRRLRDLSGLSGRELAARLGVTQSRVSRIESGAVLPPLPLVTAWAETVDATPESRQMLRELTEEAFIEKRTRKVSGNSIPDHDEEAHQRENSAQTILTLALTTIPALLQTAEYARQLFALRPLPGPPEQLAGQVADLVDRQVILFGEQRLEFLISETALRIRYSPVPAHLAQLDRIACLSTLANVSIGVIPYHHQARAVTLHGFTLYQSTGEKGTVVSVEAVHGHLRITDPDSIDRYRRDWELLHTSALAGDQARVLLRQIMTEISKHAS